MIEVVYAINTVLLFCIGIMGMLALTAYIAERALEYTLRIVKLYALFVKFVIAEVRKKKQ